MATKIEHLGLQIAHFNNFRKHIPGMDHYDHTTVEGLLRSGLMEVSTCFELALANLGGHDLVSRDEGDLMRDGVLSDAKLSTVRTSSRGRCYSAPVTSIYNKQGALRVQVYERKQNKFYYFVIPQQAFAHIPRTSNIEIPFYLNGDPCREPRNSNVRVNWWEFEVASWNELANLEKQPA